MTSFIWGEIQRRIKDGFSILLPAADAIRLFMERLKLSRITSVPQAHLRLRLILKVLAQPDPDTPSANETTNRGARRSLCGLFNPPPAYYRKYEKRTRYMIRSGSQKWTSHTRKTSAP